MVLDRDQFPDLVDAGRHGLHIERLDGVDIQHPGGDSLCRQLFCRFQSQTDRIAVCKNGNIFSFPEPLGFADLESIVFIIDHRDRVAGKAKIYRAGISRSRFDKRFGCVEVCRHDHRHVRDRAENTHVLDGLVGGTVVCRGHTAVGAGDFDVQIRIGDLLADHLADAHAAEGRIGHHIGDLAAGRKACRHAGAVLFGDADVQILLRQFLPEGAGLAGLSDVDVDNQDVSVLSAEFNDGLTEAVAGRNLFCLHAQASSLI